MPMGAVGAPIGAWLGRARAVEWRSGGAEECGEILEKSGAASVASVVDVVAAKDPSASMQRLQDMGITKYFDRFNIMAAIGEFQAAAAAAAAVAPAAAIGSFTPAPSRREYALELLVTQNEIVPNNRKVKVRARRSPLPSSDSSQFLSTCSSSPLLFVRSNVTC